MIPCSSALRALGGGGGGDSGAIRASALPTVFLGGGMDLGGGGVREPEVQSSAVRVCVYFPLVNSHLKAP